MGSGTRKPETQGENPIFLYPTRTRLFCYTITSVVMKPGRKPREKPDFFVTRTQEMIPKPDPTLAMYLNPSLNKVTFLNFTKLF